jgi:hypothetical protein
MTLLHCQKCGHDFLVFELATGADPYFCPKCGAFGRRANGPRVWFDTEFIEDGRTIDLLSIGMVREDGATYYAVSEECDTSKANDWVRRNVLPHLGLPLVMKSRKQIKAEVLVFAGEAPEFWGYYADYDWVALCQLFGRMIDLPPGWPKFCRDIKQFAMDLGNPKLPEQDGQEHHALADAIWNRLAWAFLRDRQPHH